MFTCSVFSGFESNMTVVTDPFGSPDNSRIEVNLLKGKSKMIDLIDFYAEWCGPCHAMKPVLEKIEKEYAGKINISKVDVDKESVKASQFGIMSIPTLIVLKDGKEVGRKVGAMDEMSLKNWLNSLI